MTLSHVSVQQTAIVKEPPFHTVCLCPLAVFFSPEMIFRQRIEPQNLGRLCDIFMFFASIESLRWDYADMLPKNRSTCHIEMIMAD